MSFEIEYFHERVLHEIESWPVDVLADYARAWSSCLSNMGRVSGSRTLGLSETASSNFGPVAVPALEEPSTAFSLANGSLFCTPSSRSRRKRLIGN